MLSDQITERLLPTKRAFLESAFDPDGPRSRIFTFVNPRLFAILKSDPGFERALAGFTGIGVDGIGLVGLLAIEGREVTRLSFDDSSLAPLFFSEVANRTWAVALVGGAPGEAELAASRLEAEHPQLMVTAAHHGYRADWAGLAEELVAGPQECVILGLGAPLQESFALELKRAGFEGLVVTCGGYISQKAMRASYYPGWADRLHLRWLIRLWDNPGVIGRRLLVEYLPFYRRYASAIWSRVIGR